VSGWIKVEKSLESDPRVLRMAKAICTLELGIGNACALPGVTLVCGALTRLWMYADSHARDDDSLDMGTKEIDEWLGIADFCSIVPKEWLVEIDEHRVELPGYQVHNGVEAKKRALTQKRVAQHRNKGKRQSVTPRNASSLQERYQTKTKTKTIPRPEEGEDPLPVEGLDIQAWESWITYRTKIRKPLNPASIPAAQRQLAKYAGEHSAVVEQSIAQGWTGLFGLKTLNGSAGYRERPRRKTRYEELTEKLEADLNDNG
jgi:hypothetical protein